MSTSQTSHEETQQTPPDIDVDDTMDSNPNSPPETSHTSQGHQQNQGSSRANANTQSNNGNGNGDKLASGTPGASWNNKKFKEDYDGALARLVHQDYDPSRYGDPLMS